MQPLAQDFPVVPNDRGGFNILLKPTATAATLTPPQAPNMAAPAALQEDRATREVGGPGGGWVDQIMQTVGTGDSRAQYEPPPDMGGTALPESGGPLSRMLPAGWGDTAAAAVGGLNTIDRNQSPLAAFGAGMAGAMDVREGRRKSKREEMLEMEDRQLRRDELKYQHGRDEFRDQFLVSAEERAQDAATRAGKEFQMTEAQNAQNAKIKNLELQKVKIELDRLENQSGLTTEQALTLRGQVTGSVKEQFKDVDMEEEGMPEAFRQAIVDQYNQALQGFGGGAAQGTAGAKPAGSSADNPVQWTPETAPKTPAEFTSALDAAVAANGGQPVIFIHPGTGKPRLYRGGAGAAM